MLVVEQTQTKGLFKFSDTELAVLHATNSRQRRLLALS